jgi:hypothetical protein
MISTMHPDPERDPSLNLGHGATSPESRGGSFALGAMGHALGSDGLVAAQERYNAVLPREYQQRGVAQLTQNTRSAVSLGLAPDDPRSGVFQGRRYVMTPQNGRSQSTSQAAPVFEEDV